MIAVIDTHNVQKLLKDIAAGQIMYNIVTEAVRGVASTPSTVFHGLFKANVVQTPMRNIPNGCAYKPELWNSWEEHSLS
jgi:hypothetical protein